ncbi:MAG: hypothetical protein KDN22_18785 [Verrucomicrobiae bacterium]|nr:hypothetical protein [Verrucomicrobiae bacterium]
MITAILLVEIGLFVSYWWYYKLAPVRNLTNPDWLKLHSAAARWDEEQKDYHRMGSSPDLFLRGDRIGYYGGKDWFLWLVERSADTDFRNCGCTATALALMSNQRADNWSVKRKGRARQNATTA